MMTTMEFNGLSLTSIKSVTLTELFCQQHDQPIIPEEYDIISVLPDQDAVRIKIMLMSDQGQFQTDDMFINTKNPPLGVKLHT